ncbi:unnamed protein product [marine sediment metagenome]|uniref:Uncharacterized protein n=1 Tax=marine sediment metagenome TaxID=412755 RepID=X1VKQ7_9ZZZZ
MRHRNIAKVIYEHELDCDRKVLILYLNGKEIKEVPFVISLRRTMYLAVNEIFHDVPYDLNYTSTDRDSGIIIKGHYISPLVKKMALRRKINIAKRRLTKLLNI